MSTKNNPGQFDCYANALPDEPMFVLLARDQMFYELVHLWAHRRLQAIECGERPVSDRAMVGEALNCADIGQRWRRKNLGKWRQPKTGD